MNDTFTPEPNPDEQAPPAVDEDVVLDDTIGDHPATDAVDPTSVANPSGVADPTFATENQDNTSPEPPVVGAGGQHEASDPVDLDALGSESDEVEDAAPEEVEGSESEDPEAVSQSAGNKVHKDPEDPAHEFDGGGNPVHPPEVAAAALPEHRPGVRGRPGIDD